jgi:hypothetical protein
MIPESTSKPVPEPKTNPKQNPDDVDFAEEAAPKDTEFKKDKDAKDITAGGFDLIP